LYHQKRHKTRLDPVTVSDGLYKVSVEASDLAGNKTAMSRFVYVHNDSSPFDPSLVTHDAYIRDNLQDIGDIPSTLGGRPFWTSPDIVVVLQGASVPADPNYAGNAQVKAGWTYDVYIRIHNDRCVQVERVKAKVYSANPAMIIDQSQWNPITSGNFVGDAANPNGVTVSAGGTALLGPLIWAPTAAEAAANNGHRCMLAYITCTDDPYNTLPDVVKDNDNIAQRNMQVEGLTAFSIYNPVPAEAAVSLIFNCGSLPMDNPLTVVRLSVEYHPALANGWAGVPGTTLTHDTANNKLHLDIRLCNLTLPAVTLPGHANLPASVKLELPPTVEGTFQVHFSELVNGILGGGMSFQVTNYIVK